jgi:hypothetical protein
MSRRFHWCSCRMWFGIISQNEPSLIPTDEIQSSSGQKNTQENTGQKRNKSMGST